MNNNQARSFLKVLGRWSLTFIIYDYLSDGGGNFFFVFTIRKT